jgi:sporulation protein YlmC with PRC-barrel domain
VRSFAATGVGRGETTAGNSSIDTVRNPEETPMKKIKFLSAAVAATLGLSLTAAAQDATGRVQNPPPQTDIPAANQSEGVQQKRDDTGVVKPHRTGDQAEKQTNKDQLYQVNDLDGAKIRNAKGEDLGDVKEMVVDVNDGSIRYAVVSYGGFLDIGDKLFAVPLRAMSLKHNEDGDAFFVVDIDQQRLEKAQGFDDDNWPNFADPKFASAVNKTYNVQDDAGTSSGKGALYKLSTFDGVNVRGANNKELGEIERILVDLKQAKVAYLAIDLDDEVAPNKDDDALALIPMNQFTLKTQGDDTFLQTKATADQISSAPTATKDQLDDAAKHNELRQKIDSHFGKAKTDANAERSNADRSNENDK